MNIFFPIVDNCSNPLVGSKVTIRAASPPYFIGTVLNPTASYGGPSVQYTDATGNATFTNVVPGIYKVSYTNYNANNPSLYTKYDDTFLFIQVPSSGSSTVDGFTLQVTSINNTLTSNVAWSTSASDARYVQLGGAINSASYAATASFVLNGGSNSSASYINNNATVQTGVVFYDGISTNDNVYVYASQSVLAFQTSGSPNIAGIGSGVVFADQGFESLGGVGFLDNTQTAGRVAVWNSFPALVSSTVLTAELTTLSGINTGSSLASQLNAAVSGGIANTTFTVAGTNSNPSLTLQGNPGTGGQSLTLNVSPSQAEISTTAGSGILFGNQLNLSGNGIANAGTVQGNLTGTASLASTASFVTASNVIGTVSNALNANSASVAAAYLPLSGGVMVTGATSGVQFATASIYEDTSGNLNIISSRYPFSSSVGSTIAPTNVNINASVAPNALNPAGAVVLSGGKGVFSTGSSITINGDPGNGTSGATITITPGSGHNVATGTVTLNGQVQLPNGASNGYVLTSDNSGNATWQAAASTASLALTASSVFTAGAVVVQSGNGQQISINQGSSSVIVSKFNGGATTPVFETDILTNSTGSFLQKIQILGNSNGDGNIFFSGSSPLGSGNFNIFHTGAHGLLLGTNNTARWQVTSNGDLVTQGTHAITASAALIGGNMITTGSTAGTATDMTFMNYGSDGRFYFKTMVGSSAGFIFGNTTTAALFQISPYAPDSKVYIDAVDPIIFRDNTSTNPQAIGDLNSNYYFDVQASPTSFVNGNGGTTLFGVGTNTPGFTLDVAGTANFQAGITVASGITGNVTGNLTGSAKNALTASNGADAWLAFTTSGSGTSFGNFNAYNIVTPFTRQAIGVYAFKFVNALADSTYAVSVNAMTGSQSAPTASLGSILNKTTTGFTASFQALTGTFGVADITSASVCIFG